MVKTAVIIAAGNGTRLKGVSGDLPKPLIPVVGVPLIERVMRSAIKAGIESFIIVTGYKAGAVRSHVDGIPDLSERVTWVHNPDFRHPNGGSVLAARTSAPEEFALLMSDHLFEPEALARLLRAPRGPGECLLGVDRNLDGIFDMEDATKVRLTRDRISEIGKTLESFDAVDTGMFVCSSSLFDALDASLGGEAGCSLTDGVRRLARQGRVRFMEVDGAAWQDVDTPESLRQARRMLYRSTRKPTDGIISRTINRPVSIQFTKLFLALGLTPNHVSAVTLLVGLIAAWMISHGDYASVAIAGVLFHLSSVLDGSDGEVAKLRMNGSKRGEWVDTFVDFFTYLAFWGGVTLGYYQRTQSSVVLPIGFFSLALLILTFSVLCFYLMNAGGGSLRRFATAFSGLARSDRDGQPVFRFLNRLGFAVRRDFFSFLFCVFALLDRLDWIFAAIILGITMMTGAVGLSAGRLLRDSGARAPSPETVVKKGIEEEGSCAGD